MTKYEICSLIFSGLTFSAAVTVAIIYGCQLVEMQKSTKAVTQAAKATEQSVQAARDTIEIDQRAWISLVGFSPRFEVGKPVEATVAFTNTGKTPARNMFLQAVIQIAVRDGVPDYSLIEKEAGDNPDASRSMVFPGAQSTGKGKAKWGALTQAHVDQLKSGDQRIFYFGRFEYDDVFGKHHWLRFSTVYAPDLGAFNYWRDGNMSDD